MGQAARNHGGTRGHGYPGEPKGKPDAKMFAPAPKSPKRCGVGIEVVTRQEFETRQKGFLFSGPSDVCRGLSDEKGRLFIEKPLASPGSAKNIRIRNLNDGRWCLDFVDEVEFRQ